MKPLSAAPASLYKAAAVNNNSFHTRFVQLFSFKKILVDTCPFMGPLIPLFWTSGDVSCGFQSQSWKPYLYLAEGRGVCVICSLRFTSGMTPADLLVIATKPFSYMYM